MKLKKFTTQTKKVGICEIINIEEEHLQYLSNGYTVFPVHDLPPLDNATLFSLLDIEKDKQELFTVSRVFSTHYNSKDVDKTEMPLETARFILRFDEFRNTTIRPVFTETGLYYYDPSWLAPFADENYQLFIRRGADKRPYIAVKAGMFVIGFICLVDFNFRLDVLTDKGKEDLLNLAAMIEVKR
jgi:hypothetical protein